MTIPLTKGLRRSALCLLSTLLASHARPSPDDLIKLSRSGPDTSCHSFSTRCLKAVASAANPFIPGMSLSVELAKAARVAQEGEKRALLSLQKSVDSLLLEILERLPSTVRGFDRGMDGCCTVFEPENIVSTEVARRIPGPLAQALDERQQTDTFCNVPLVMDFLSRRFTRGLPNLRDTDGVLKDPVELHDMRGGADGGDGSLVLDCFLSLKGQADGVNDSGNLPFSGSSDLPGRNSVLTRFLYPRALLQGACSSFPSLTYLPGAQFVAAGLLAKPCNYYRVPAMRMMLDFVVYVGMLAVFSIFVTNYDDGALHWGEAVVAAYIVGGCLREGREISRGASKYFRDRWNVLDVAILLFLAAGLISSLGSGSNQWSHAFYAVSAPLFYARLLFFTQVLRMPGPMIEVILSMTLELARFGTVMVVVMIGFAVSFHALFRNDDSFGVTLLDLFKAMLGEVEFFDDFSGGRGDAVATVLLVAYLLIMAIMLLNLLVAILSTSHAKVQGNVEREFRVSKAHIIQQYRLVVDEHLLPAPLNLVQLVLSCVLSVVPCRYTREGYTRAKEAVGRLVFCLVLGPLAVAAGALLWMTSMFTFTFAWRKYYSERMGSLVLSAKHRDDLPGRANLLLDQDKGWPWTEFMVVTHLMFGLWCLVGAPLCLLALWLRNTLKCTQAVVRVCFRRLRADSSATQATPPDQSTSLGRRADGGPNDRADLCPSDRARVSSSDRARVSSRDRAGATAADVTTDFTIQAMLKRGAGGIGVDELRKFLKNPMSDSEVREDEKQRSVTVEHLKLLQNRIERTCGESRASKTFTLQLAEKLANNDRECAELKNELGSVLRALNAKNGRLEHLERECNESKQDRIEIKSILDAVLMALGSMQPKPTAMCSVGNTNKAGAHAPLS